MINKISQLAEQFYKLSDEQPSKVNDENRKQLRNKIHTSLVSLKGIDINDAISFDSRFSSFEKKKLTDTLEVAIQAMEEARRIIFRNDMFTKRASAEAPESLKGTIERASSQTNLGIPNFRKVLDEYNKENSPQIGSLRLSIQIGFWKSLEVISGYLIPVDGTAAVLTPELNNMMEGLKTGIPAYFKQYPETINDVSSGIYVAEYKIATNSSAPIV